MWHDNPLLLQHGLLYSKRSLMSWVVVIPKVTRPSFFLYDTDYLIFEPTCAHARWAHMHCILSVCMSVTWPKFRLDKKSQSGYLALLCWGKWVDFKSNIRLDCFDHWSSRNSPFNIFILIMTLLSLSSFLTRLCNLHSELIYALLSVCLFVWTKIIW